MISRNDFLRVTNNVHGNPRYVIHYVHLADTYNAALKAAKELGGKKYHNKSYGGGIVFSTYNLPKLIAELNNTAQRIEAPTHWSAYLVNGDLSGFTEQEEAAVLAFEKKFGRCEGVPEDVGLVYCEHIKEIAECSIYYMIKEG